MPIISMKFFQGKRKTLKSIKLFPYFLMLHLISSRLLEFTFAFSDGNWWRSFSFFNMREKFVAAKIAEENNKTTNELRKIRNFTNFLIFCIVLPFLRVLRHNKDRRYVEILEILKIYWVYCCCGVSKIFCWIFKTFRQKKKNISLSSTPSQFPSNKPQPKNQRITI